MTGNLIPWFILFGIVVVTLVLKGYVPLPSTRRPADPLRSHKPAAPLATATDSDTLGLAFAMAKKREAEEELAVEIARKAGEDLKAAFKAPFSAPGAPAAPPSASKP